MKGNVSGASVTVAGAVQGDVRASDAVLLERGARVVGDLTAPRIGVSTGALVRGLVRTDGEPPLTGARRAGGLGRAPQAFATRAQPAPKADASDESAQAQEAGDQQKDKAQDKGPREAPPPPVVPALAKGQKAKKKKKAD